jgi:RHS repeat-associated protein
VARYLPYGRWRTEPTADLTDRGYTGHKHNDDLGLIYMNARYYLPGIGRFISADTLVPDPTNPQQFNRYTYVLNNPLRYTDPTGHYCYDPTFGEAAGQCYSDSGNLINHIPGKQPNRLPGRSAVDPLDKLWNLVMDTYGLESGVGFWKFLADIHASGLGWLFDNIAAQEGSQAFGKAGKLMAKYSLAMDGAAYAARTYAIYQAWNDPDFEMNEAQLRYLNTRSTAEALSSGAITIGSMAAGPVASTGVFFWNLCAITCLEGDLILAPDALIAKSYATARHHHPGLWAVREIDAIADYLTFLMIIDRQSRP